MALQAKRNFKTITCYTKYGKYIVYPAVNDKVKVKKGTDQNSKEVIVGYFDLKDSTWHCCKGMTIPFSVRNIVEESYCA